MKLLPSRRVLCTPYNHVTLSKLSHIRKAEWLWSFTCYCGNTCWNGYRNKSQHRKLTLDKEILPPLLQGLQPATCQSRVRRSNHWAIPVPQATMQHMLCHTFVHWMKEWRLRATHYWMADTSEEETTALVALWLYTLSELGGKNESC